jgi:Lon protease-like protein
MVESPRPRPVILPDDLPLFPLPNVVLFPDAYLPLHVFEPRYRALTRDALAGPRLIGMVVLREGWQEDDEAAPAIYATGCAGTIVHHEALPDGRSNIILQGVGRFTVAHEIAGDTPYRRARVEWQPEVDASGIRVELTRLRQQIERLLLPAVARGEVRMPAGLSDQALVNAVCQAIDVPTIEKLALLEKPDVVTRALALLPRLERLMLDRSGSGQVH